jgi:Inner membrane protein YgaP-like, transmembrane domain
VTLNVGGIDRLIRIVIGLVLIALGLFHVVTGTAAIVAYVVAAIAIITGIVRFCPAWAMFGINTSSSKSAQ